MSRFEIRSGLLGLGLMIGGGVLHGFTGSAALALLVEPTGAMLVAGVGLIQRRRGRLTARRALGLGLIVAGSLGVAVLACLTAERFLGRPEEYELRPLVWPAWITLLRLHAAWSAAAISVAAGVRLFARASLERCLGIGLAVFAGYPTVPLACGFVIAMTA